MFHTILIANRGEIACRIIRACRAMGVRSVAVYSDADADALHRREADRAVRIGPAPAAGSYLRADRIIAAALETGAQAIHPGYGFLSENPDFVEAVGAAGLVFIGPSASAIRAMGLKDAAKRLMEEAGVPVVPGYHGEEQDPDFLAGQADTIGYPVLIKARAGGGGKGMRRVDDATGFADALESARREAAAAFGDERVLVEKYVASPRHIEIQVFGDGHGNAVHLFERDCSLQRRHQKVIEEAPAPGMTPAMRAAMGAAAVRAAKAIDYAGAGTVEFIVDASGGLREDRFYFMEMNTRLQVEHPVTEEITGLDLVALQLRVAAGEALPLTQDDLSIDGWAFEARLYAEDPARGFLPQTGTLHHLDLPFGLARIETGVEQGGIVSPHYDPMIAKIVSRGPTREAALDALHAALSETRIAGLRTNRSFLRALCRHEGFRRGEVDTGLIGRDLDILTARPGAPAGAVAVAAVEVLGLAPSIVTPCTDIACRLSGWRLWGEGTSTVVLTEDGVPLEARVVIEGGGRFRVTARGDEITFATPVDPLLALDPGGDALRIDGWAVDAQTARAPGAVTVFLDDEAFVFGVPDPLAGGPEEGAGADGIVSPMPGLVKLVRVQAGDTVRKGERLMVLEAMKMEHALTAPRDGVVAEVMARDGDQTQDGALLLRLEAVDD